MSKPEQGRYVRKDGTPNLKERPGDPDPDAPLAVYLLRYRSLMRQSDLARAARVGRMTVVRCEQGRRMTVSVLNKLREVAAREGWADLAAVIAREIASRNMAAGKQRVRSGRTSGAPCS
jgi:predicted transcriptional regulator